MAHGYAKIAYKPMAIAVHGTVGLQHAAMGIYNAYCDRAPMVILAGNHMEATGRRPGAEWHHSALDCVKLVRDFIKWDDTPGSAEAMVAPVQRTAHRRPSGPKARSPTRWLLKCFQALAGSASLGWKISMPLPEET